MGISGCHSHVCEEENTANGRGIFERERERERGEGGGGEGGGLEKFVLGEL